MATKRLSVVIDANVSKFKKNVNSMQGTMDKATGGIGGALKKVGGAFTGLIGTIGKIAGTVGLFKLVDGAINMITSSFDKAISRVDTLNQFPRVLQQMGYTAEEANASTARLSEGIQGLPTTLDGIVSSTQRLVTIFGDVDLATESALALNNAFLASGASQEDANRGLEQYVQMLSAGKVDMQSWRTLQETMPYALNETAEAFGFTGKSAQNDFYAALQSGEITMDEMNAKLIELSTETGGFAETALEASKGIKTSWQNIQTAVATGVANVITAFDDWLESAGFGGIAGVLDIIKERVQETFGNFAEWVPGAIEWMVNLYNTITESTAFQTLQEVVQLASDKITEFSESSAWETITTTLGEIGQAILDIDFNEVLAGIQEFLDKWGVFIAFWVGAFAVFKTITIIMALFTGLATAIAFLTSPIGIVVVAITALIAIGIALWKNWDEIKAKASEIWGSIKDFFSETWESIKTTVSETWDGIKEYLSELWEGIVTSVSDFFTPIIEFFTTLWEDVKASFETGWETITNVLTVAWMFIEELFGLLFDIIMIPWNFIWENFAEPLTEVWEGIKTFLSESLETIGNWISEKWEAIKSFTSKAWDAILQAVVKPLVNMVKDTIRLARDIWRAITDKWEEIKTSTKSKWEEVKKAVTDPIKQAYYDLKNRLEEIATGILAKWEEIKTNTTTKWNEVKSSIVDPIKEAWNNVKTKVDEIKTGIKTRFNSVKTNVTTTWNNIKDAIMKPINKARDTVEKAINKIKGFMDFKWELPKLKMPKFSISGKFGLNPPSVPKMGIDWYAKGGIATGPSIVGIGEAGDEAILPLSNKSKMKPFASAVASMMPNGGYGGNVSGGDTVITGNTFVVREEADIKKIAQELKRLDDRESRSRGRRGLGN